MESAMKQIKTIAITATMVVVGTTMAFAQDGHAHANDWHMYPYHFGGMHMVWWIIWIVFIFIIFGLYEPVPRKKNKENAPFTILQKRFASGEITKEEYEERKKILEKH